MAASGIGVAFGLRQVATKDLLKFITDNARQEKREFAIRCITSAPSLMLRCKEISSTTYCLKRDERISRVAILDKVRYLYGTFFSYADQEVGLAVGFRTPITVL